MKISRERLLNGALLSLSVTYIFCGCGSPPKRKPQSPGPYAAEALRLAQLRRKEVLKDLSKVTKVDIIAGECSPLPSFSSEITHRGQVLGAMDKKKQGSDLASLMHQLGFMLRHPHPSSGIPGSAYPICLRLHITEDKTMIHCNLASKMDYFLVDDKWPWPPTPVTTPRPPKVVTRKGRVVGYDHSWFPKGYVRLSIPCTPTREFREIILRQMTPGVRKAVKKW